VVEQDTDRGTTVRLHVNAKTRSFLDGVRSETGVPKEIALARIVEWYVSLDPKLRLAVLNRDEATKAELLRDALVKVGGGMAGTLEEAIVAANAANARVQQLAQRYRTEAAEGYQGRAKKK
jgi:hypothetical protein